MGNMNQTVDYEIQRLQKSPINWQNMEQRNLDAESLKLVLPVFIESSACYISDLQQAWDDNDKEAVRSIAHKIKGCAANVGAEELSETAELLNRGCRRGDLDNGAELIQRIKQLHKELQIYISGLK